MADTMLEHINVTVSDGQKTAKMLCELFDWHIRWQGSAKLGGHTIHVGGENSYLAIYSLSEATLDIGDSYRTPGAMNHIGVVVDDLDEVERRVKSAGFETTNHGDYEPGRRFYFHDADDIEFEVVSYA